MVCLSSYSGIIFACFSDSSNSYTGPTPISPINPETLRKVVEQIERSRLVAEESGILHGFRYDRAWEVAFDEYAPKSLADKPSQTFT